MLSQLRDVDQHSCELLGKTALIVQALMGVLVIFSLAYKRQRESPKRPWKIWIFDVSKQVVGQLFVHGANLLVSGIVAELSSSDACVFYFLNILIDTTLGVALIYFILRALAYLCTEKFHLKGCESGKYGTPPSIKYWTRQAAIYVVALTSMKFLVIALLALFPGLNKVGSWLLSWTYTSNGNLRVVFTMGIFPIIMNILQFWLIDSIVKAKEAVILGTETPDALNESEREPLFDVSSDDEDHPSSDLENQRPASPGSSHSTRSARDKTGSGSNTPEESKSVGSSSANGVSALHLYPPATKLNKKGRKTPSPLTITSMNQPAFNVKTPRTPASSNSKTFKPVAHREWDEPDDWANRVGEEDWTGRRIGRTMDSLHDTWTKQIPVG
ncbi:vacuolar membrane protein-domain-containing protein [Mycena floridula]|nr:vacuolar membrane protein-domain-containing protein [Mycena floridula]